MFQILRKIITAHLAKQVEQAHNEGLKVAEKLARNWHGS